jgi:hypothetical protein
MMAAHQITVYEGPHCPLGGFAHYLGHSWFLHVFQDSLAEDFKEECAGRLDLSAPPEYVTYLDDKLGEARGVLEEAMGAFSPRGLIDQGPLKELPATIRALVKAGVHDRYLETHFVQLLCTELRFALEEMEQVAQGVATGWSTTGRAELIRYLLSSSDRLRKALEAFPVHIVLP